MFYQRFSLYLGFVFGFQSFLSAVIFAQPVVYVSNQVTTVFV